MRYHGIFDKHKRPQRLQWQTGNEFDGSDFTGNRYTGGKGTKEMVFCYQNCSSDWEKLLKFEAAGREFAKCLRSQEQFIQTVKGQNSFW